MKKSSITQLLAVFVVQSFAPMAGVHAAETKLEGVLFANYSLYTSRYKTANTEALKYNAFDIGRVYVTAATAYTPDLASKIVLEASTLSAGNAVFLKQAFLQWKDPSGGFTVEGGMPGTLWISAEESVWKYRFVEKVQTDLEGVLQSADRGVKVVYKLPEGLGTAEGMLSNGEGYKALENTDYKGKGKDGQLRLALTPFRGFKELSVSAHYLGGVALYRSRERLVGGAAYQGKKFSLGASMFRAVDFSVPGYAASSATVRTGFSIYGNLPLTSSLSFFARLDKADNNLRDNDYDKKTMMLAGVSCELAKDVRVAATERRTTQGTAADRRRDQNIVSLDLMAKF